MASSTLVVEKLPGDVTEDDLEELFSKEGPLASVNFESSTSAVVKFCNSNDAKEAMDKLNGTKLKGNPMIITWCGKQCPSSDAKLWVSIKGSPINFDNLEALLLNSCVADSVKMVLQHLGTSYWIVQFDSKTSATNAIKTFNNARIYGVRFLALKYDDCKDLYVEYRPKDLDDPKDLDKKYIVSVFSLYGECTVNIKKDKSSGNGFVSYHTSEGVEDAVRNLNGVDLGSHHLYVRGIVMQAVTEDNNVEEVPTFVSEDNNAEEVPAFVAEDNNLEEVPIFVIEGNRRQLLTTINMKDFSNISDFCQSLINVWDAHKHNGLEGTSHDIPWHGYEVRCSHVGHENELVLKLWEDVEPFFNEDPNEQSKEWFLGSVNKIEIYEKKAVPLVNLNA